MSKYVAQLAAKVPQSYRSEQLLVQIPLVPEQFSSAQMLKPGLSDGQLLCYNSAIRLTLGDEYIVATGSFCGSVST